MVAERWREATQNGTVVRAPVGLLRQAVAYGEFGAVLSEILKVVRYTPLPRGMAARKSAFGDFCRDWQKSLPPAA